MLQIIQIYNRSGIEEYYLDPSEGSILTRLSVLTLTLAASPLVSGAVIDFENLTGPSLFANAGNATTLNISTSIGTVIVSGGVILRTASNLPADQTSIYGTASTDFIPGIGTSSTDILRRGTIRSQITRGTAQHSP